MIKQHWQMMERGVAGVLIAMSLQYSAMAQTENVPIPDVAEVPGGWFFQGSDSVERQYAYQIDEHVYGHDISRRNRWYDVEIDKWHIYLPTYFIMTTPVTNDQYAAFIRDTGYASPDITSEDWESLGLIYGYDATRPFAWKGDTPPRGKGNYPVVLVSWRDAQAYARWLREKTGMRWRLPPEHYWERPCGVRMGHFTRGAISMIPISLTVQIADRLKPCRLASSRRAPMGFMTVRVRCLNGHQAVRNRDTGL